MQAQHARPTEVPPPIALGDLGGIGRTLREDGSTVVRDLPRFGLPDVAGALAYRVDRLHDRERSGRAVALRQSLRPGVRGRLDALVAWPVRTVVDGTDPTGVVVTQVPPDHRQQMRLPSGAVRTVDRELGFLLVSPDTARRLGLPHVDRATRLAVCQALAEGLRFLHELGVTLGGLHAGELTVRLEPAPAVRFRGTGVDAVGGDRSDDLRTLGLLVLRVLTPGAFRSTARDPGGAAGALDASGLALLAGAVDGAAADRPSAHEWTRVLARQPGHPGAPPVLHDVRAHRTLVPVGEPVVVSWVGDGIEAVEVAGPGCPPVAVQADAGSGTVTVHPTGSGRLTLTARGTSGVVAHDLGPIAVLDVPRVGAIPLPVPQLPWPDVHGHRLPDVSVVLPGLPPTPSVPALSVLGGLGPEAPGRSAPGRPAQPLPPPPALGEGALAFPLDLANLFTSAPDLPAAPGPRRRLFRRRVKT